MDKIASDRDPVKGFPSPDPGGLALSAEGLGRMCSHLEATDQEHTERLTALAAALEELTAECSRMRAEETRTIGLTERLSLEIRMLRAGQESLRQKVCSLAGDVEAVESLNRRVQAIEEAVEDEPATALSPRARISMN